MNTFSKAAVLIGMFIGFLLIIAVLIGVPYFGYLIYTSQGVLMTAWYVITIVALGRFCSSYHQEN